MGAFDANTHTLNHYVGAPEGTFDGHMTLEGQPDMSSDVNYGSFDPGMGLNMLSSTSGPNGFSHASGTSDVPSRSAALWHSRLYGYPYSQPSLPTSAPSHFDPAGFYGPCHPQTRYEPRRRNPLPFSFAPSLTRTRGPAKAIEYLEKISSKLEELIQTGKTQHERLDQQESLIAELGDKVQQQEERIQRLEKMIHAVQTGQISQREGMKKGTRSATTASSRRSQRDGSWSPYRRPVSVTHSEDDETVDVK